MNNIGTVNSDNRELHEVPMEEINQFIKDEIIPNLDNIMKSRDNTEVITPSIYNMEGIDSMFPKKIENNEINKSTSIYNMDGINSMIPEKLKEEELSEQDLENARKLKESILNGDDFSEKEF